LQEANAGPWQRLAERSGASLKIWQVDRKTATMTKENLQAVLSSKTRILVWRRSQASIDRTRCRRSRM